MPYYLVNVTIRKEMMVKADSEGMARSLITHRLIFPISDSREITIEMIEKVGKEN